MWCAPTFIFDLHFIYWNYTYVASLVHIDFIFLWRQISSQSLLNYPLRLSLRCGSLSVAILLYYYFFIIWFGKRVRKTGLTCICHLSTKLCLIFPFLIVWNRVKLTFFIWKMVGMVINTFLSSEDINIFIYCNSKTGRGV